jgi:hypothetical protein
MTPSVRRFCRLKKENEKKQKRLRKQKIERITKPPKRM